MFVERSAARIRLVRTLFVLGCLLPTLGLAGWAVYRHSSAALDPLLAAWSQSVGFRVTVEGVERLRPSVVRLRDLVLEDANRRRVAAVAVAEIEERAEGTVLRLPKLSLDRFAVASFAAASRRWLMEPVRYPRGGVIGVDELSWRGADGERPLGGFRIEFVVVESGRAIRIRREPADDDELRLRAIRAADGLQFEADLICERGLPAELVAAASGWMPRFGSAATIRGRLRATASGGDAVSDSPQWRGSGNGVVTGVDLVELAGVAGQVARGDAVLRIENLSLVDGRITAARFLLSAEEGSLGRGLLERMVTVLGCRFGPAGELQSARADWLAGPAFPFDQAAVAVEIDRSGVIVGAAGLGGATVVASAGQSLLEAAGERIPFERFAWLFAPTATGMVPATIPASPRALEVLSRLPIATEAAGGRF